MSGGAQAVESCLDRLSDKIRQIIDGINAALRWVPDFLADLLGNVMDKWNEFCRRMEEFWALVTEIAGYGWGDADALRDAAEQYEDAISDLLDSAYDALSNDAIKADTTWRGEAGDKYAAGFQNQIDEIRNSKDAAEALGEVLEDHASALDTFYDNLTAGLLGTLASLGGLVVSVIALVPPVTPIGIVGIIVSLIGLSVSLYYLFRNEWNDLQRMVDLGEAALGRAREEMSLTWPSIVHT